MFSIISFIRRVFRYLPYLAWGVQQCGRLLYAASWAFFWLGHVYLGLICLFLGMCMSWSQFRWEMRPPSWLTVGLYALYGAGEASLCGGIVSAFLMAYRGMDLGMVCMAQVAIAGLIIGYSMGMVGRKDAEWKQYVMINTLQAIFNAAGCQVCNDHAWGDEITELEDGEKVSIEVPCPQCNANGLTPRKTNNTGETTGSNQEN